MGAVNQIPETSLEQDHGRASKRVRSIDTFRALAALAVVVIHVPPPGDLPQYWSIILKFCSAAVPFFALASGYFFTRALMQADSCGPVVRKYVVRLGVVVVFWTAFYTFVPPFISAHGDVPGWTRACELLRHPLALLFGGIYHLWYLNVILRSLLIIAFCYWIGCVPLALLFGLLPFVKGLLYTCYSFLGWHGLSGGGTCVLFFAAAGAILARHPLRVSARAALIMFFAGIAGQLMEALWIHGRYGISLNSFSYSLGTIPYALGLFLFALSRPDFGTKWALPSLGRYALGVYVIHPYMGAVLSHIPALHPLFRFPVLEIPLLFSAALAATFVLSKQRFLAPLLK